MDERWRVNALNEEVVSAVKRLRQEEVAEAVRRWEGEPPATTEVTEHFVHKLARERGLDPEKVQRTTMGEARVVVRKHLERLAKNGVLLRRKFDLYRTEWARDDALPKHVYLHKDNEPKAFLPEVAHFIPYGRGSDSRPHRRADGRR